MARVEDFLTRKLGLPQKQEVGIGGFTLLVRVRESVKYPSDAPTVAVEDGSFINDHIILKPITITIEGEVSDIHLEPSPAIRQFQRAQAEIGNLTSEYASTRTQAQLSKVSALANDVADAVRRIDNLLDKGEQALDYFGNRDNETKSIQEQFLDAMEALRNGKQAFAIDMPYRRHENMVLTSLSVDYDNEQSVTGFTVEAQQILLAELLYSQIVGQPAEGLNGQLSGEVDKGTQEGTPVTESFLTQVSSALGF